MIDIRHVDHRLIVLGQFCADAPQPCPGSDGRLHSIVIGVENAVQPVQ